MLTLDLDSSSPVVPGRLSLLAYYLSPPYKQQDLHEVLLQEEVAVGTSPVPVAHNVVVLAEGARRGMLAGWWRGCKLALLPSALRIGDGLSCFHLYGEAWTGWGGGGGVGGRHWLGVRFVDGRGNGGVNIVWLRWRGVRWGGVVLVLEWRGVAHWGPVWWWSPHLVGRVIAVDREVLAVRHIVIQLLKKWERYRIR